MVINTLKKHIKNSDTFLVITSVFLLSIHVNSVFAHNTSWNKAIIKISNKRLDLTLRIDQNDLLGAVKPETDSISTISHDEWKELLPDIRNYVFNNTYLEINDIHLTNGIDDDWRLERDQLSDHDDEHAHIGVIELSRSWQIADSLRTLDLKLDLLENVDMPVKWVVLIFSDNIPDKKLYQIVSRAKTVSYDFARHIWTDSLGIPLSGGDDSTVWGKLAQFIKIGFNHISLEKIFKSTEDPKIMLLYLLIAILIGAFHSLSPGHGKALIGAYIIGTKGTVKDAIILGVVTAASHTISVLILGVILLIAFDAVVPDDIASYLNAVSGLIILIIGIYLLNGRFREMKSGGHSHDHHGHSDHTHAEHSHSQHDHEHHDHSHSHDHQHITLESIRKNSLWTNIMMGISGGMVPCPTALVVLFLAISLNKLALGLILIIFFSFGLAATLTALGILFAKGSKIINKYDNNKIVAKLPVISAGIIVVLGGVISIRALMNLL